MSQPKEPENNDNPHRRRVRYSGNHPRHFAEKYKDHTIDAYPDLKEHLQQKGKTPAGTHVPILVSEIMETLHPMPGEIVADCTLGYGGHAREFVQRIGATGKFVGLDADGVELEKTRQRLTQLYPEASMVFCRSNFAGIANVMQREAPDGFDIIFADLGLSSMQIDNPDRGMSYRHDGPLDMRMDARRKQTAADLLNTLSQDELSEALWQLSDEPDHGKIARRITESREREPFLRVSQLVELVLEVKGLTVMDYKRQQRQQPGGLHPAAKTFQALRMLVNDEIGVLKELLRTAPHCLRPGGRLGLISFHSGEDRLVKQAFINGLRDGLYSQIAAAPITPTREEIAINTRSTSAKFRWAIRAK